MVIKHVILITTIAILQLCATSALADVYKYQDKNGKWHFTDKPQKNKTTTADIMVLAFKPTWLINGTTATTPSKSGNM